MEKTVLDFFIKSSELILHNRLDIVKPYQQSNNNNKYEFQLNINQNFALNSKIPFEWMTSNEKLLVIEFYLASKSNKEKFLMEQWIFTLSPVCNEKLKFTVDSFDTLYKKLSVLLRTISVLSVTLPLYNHFIREKKHILCGSFQIDYAIHFSNHNLFNWDPSIHENGYFANYINPDLIYPGQIFSFQLNYSKSLKFLQKKIDESSFSQILNFSPPKQNLHVNHFANPIHSLSDTNLSGPINKPSTSHQIQSPKKQSVSTSHQRQSPEKQSVSATNIYTNNRPSKNIESHKYKFSNIPSPKNPSMASVLSDHACSPISTLSSPIETQKMSAYINFEKSRKNSPATGSGLTRQRLSTINSEYNEEYDMYIYENDIGFTEIISAKEFHLMTQSPIKFSHHPQPIEDPQYYMQIYTDVRNEYKVSTNNMSIQKIIHENTDDQIAEIISVVDELKNAYEKKCIDKNNQIPLNPNFNEQYKLISAKNIDNNLYQEFADLTNFYHEISAKNK